MFRQGRVHGDVGARKDPPQAVRVRHVGLNRRQVGGLPEGLQRARPVAALVHDDHLVHAGVRRELERDDPPETACAKDDRFHARVDADVEP